MKPENMPKKGMADDLSPLEEMALLYVRAHEGDPDAMAMLHERGRAGDGARLVDRIDAQWHLTGALADHADFERLRGEALTYVQSPSPRWRVSGYGVAIAACCAFLVLLAAGFLMQRLKPHETVEFASSQSAPRVVTLSDGSTVALDVRSRIAVDFSQSRRTVDLTAGQARFVVAHDPDRPFDVGIGSLVVRAVGTDFNIDSDGKGFVVSLIEGRVDVGRLADTWGWLGRKPAIRPDEVIKMRAGQQLVLRPEQRARLRAFDAADATAWQQGHLVLDNAELDEAIGAVNRYAAVPIRLSPHLARPYPRVGGSFKAHDSEAFVRNLTLIYPQLSAHRERDGWVITAR